MTCIRIARLVVPGLKVHCLSWADTEKNSQNFSIGYPLSQRGVKAGAALLNKAEVKSRGESDCFDVVAGIVRIVEFGITSGNRRMLSGVQTRNTIWEGCAEIRVGGAAIAGPPTGVHRELLEVGQSPGLRDERDLTGRQVLEMAQVDLLLPFGF